MGAHLPLLGCRVGCSTLCRAGGLACSLLCSKSSAPWGSARPWCSHLVTSVLEAFSVKSSSEKGSGYVIIKLRTNAGSEKATGARWARDTVPVETLAVRPEAAAVQGRERSHLVCVLGPIGCWWGSLMPQTVPASPQPRCRLREDSTLFLSSQLDFSELLCSGRCAGSGRSGRLVSLGPVKRLPSDRICWGPSSPRFSRTRGSAMTSAMWEAKMDRRERLPLPGSDHIPVWASPGAAPMPLEPGHPPTRDGVGDGPSWVHVGEPPSRPVRVTDDPVCPQLMGSTPTSKWSTRTSDPHCTPRRRLATWTSATC